MTWTWSARSDRTAARASSSVSPATNRSTTLRVAGLPVTARRSPGRRDAASSAFCISTDDLQDVGVDTPTLGTGTPSGQGQMSRVGGRALIQMYKTGERGARCATTCRNSWTTCRGCWPPRPRSRTPSSRCSPSAPTTTAGPSAMDAVRTRSILTRGSPAATRSWFEEFGIAVGRGTAAHAGRRGAPGSSPAWSSRSGTPDAPAATSGSSTAGASTRPTPTTARSPLPSTWPPRPVGCSPSGTPPTRTSAGPSRRR